MQEQESELTKYLKAGKILKKTLDYARKHVKEGVGFEDLAERVEQYCKDEGGGPAFPLNIGVNEVAAHYTPKKGDESVIPENALVKLDMGVHVDGFVTDSAVSVDLSGEHGDLIESVEKALANAASILKPGLEVSRIGEEIEKTITSYDYNPIQNLGGHGIDRWQVHTAPHIPNINAVTGQTLPLQGAFAIEPFATTGRGKAVEGPTTEIFELLNPNANTRNPVGRKLLEKIKDFQGLPFAKRWIDGEFTSQLQLKMAFKELLDRGSLLGHAELVEKDKGVVAQSETCFYAENSEVHVLVKHDYL